MPFNPAGTVTLRPMPSKVMNARQDAGTLVVTSDSVLSINTLAANFVSGTTVTGITARAGGGQALATVLTGSNNFISVCATGADSVVLPSGAPVGAPVFVRNGGAASAQVFATTPGTINGVATGTGVALAAGASATYRQSVAGTWFS
jgi:hypothetical protein